MPPVPALAEAPRPGQDSAARSSSPAGCDQNQPKLPAGAAAAPAVTPPPQSPGLERSPCSRAPDGKAAPP